MPCAARAGAVELPGLKGAPFTRLFRPPSARPQHILFYQLPEHAHFYSELLNLMEEGEGGEMPTVTVVFSKVDALRLERVVGTARSAKMLKNRKTSTFLFC